MIVLCFPAEVLVQGQASKECPGPGKAVPLVSVVRGAVGDIKEPGQSVIRTTTEWKALWKRLGLPLKPAPPAPDVDFSTAMVVAVFSGQGRGVLEVEIKGAERRAGCLLINVSERHVPDNLPASQFGTFCPFHIVRLAKGPERVVFKHASRKG